LFQALIIHSKQTLLAMKTEQELTDPILMEKYLDKEPIPGVKEVLKSTIMKRPQVAILSEEGFEEIELTSPKNALEHAGAKVDVISPRYGKIKGWDKTDWGREVDVDINLSEANVEDYDALVLPGV